MLHLLQMQKNHNRDIYKTAVNSLVTSQFHFYYDNYLFYQCKRKFVVETSSNTEHRRIRPETEIYLLLLQTDQPGSVRNVITKKNLKLETCQHISIEIYVQSKNFK